MTLNLLLALLGVVAPVRALRLQLSEVETLPDPKCATGLISLPAKTGDRQACCPSYCGECSDYPTCKSVRGQDSQNACCSSKVLEMQCGKGAPANVCLKSCAESLPPCIMDAGVKAAVAPRKGTRMAGDDCTDAVSDWRLKAAAAKSGTTAAPTTTAAAEAPQLEAAAAPELTAAAETTTVAPEEPATTKDPWADDSPSYTGVLVRLGGTCGTRGAALSSNVENMRACAALAEGAGVQAFSLGKGIQNGKCYAETLPVDDALKATWDADKANAPCPSGGWKEDKTTDFYYLEEEEALLQRRKHLQKKH